MTFLRTLWLISLGFLTLIDFIGISYFSGYQVGKQRGCAIKYMTCQKVSSVTAESSSDSIPLNMKSEDSSDSLEFNVKNDQAPLPLRWTWHYREIYVLMSHAVAVPVLNHYYIFLGKGICYNISIGLFTLCTDIILFKR